jgi:CBS-domain-containing membrane protein
MKTATMRPFVSLTAVDVMSRDVVALPQHISLRTAAHLLANAHVTGAPVIDESGVCIGVLSSTDFIHWAEKEHHPLLRAGRDCVSCEWQMVEVEDLPADEVSDSMTPDPVTVQPSTSITELARMMLDAHIHRVVVVDHGGRPVGIVSSTDVLAAAANADVAL